MPRARASADLPPRFKRDSCYVHQLSRGHTSLESQECSWFSSIRHNNTRWCIRSNMSSSCNAKDTAS
eukprot:1145258-Amphidinium_carterae.2